VVVVGVVSVGVVVDGTDVEGEVVVVATPGLVAVVVVVADGALVEGVGSAAAVPASARKQAIAQVTTANGRDRIRLSGGGRRTGVAV